MQKKGKKKKREKKQQSNETQNFTKEMHSPKDYQMSTSYKLMI